MAGKVKGEIMKAQDWLAEVFFQVAGIDPKRILIGVVLENGSVATACFEIRLEDVIAITKDCISNIEAPG